MLNYKLPAGRDHVLWVHSYTLSAQAWRSLAQNRCQIKLTKHLLSNYGGQTGVGGRTEALGLQNVHI